MKYKIGDRVIVEKGNIEIINPVAGRVGTIVDILGETFRYRVKFDEHLYIWCDVKDYAPGESKIVITHNGKITTAKLYENGKVVKTAEAKCCPEDTFDFNVGAKLAVERLTVVKEKPVEVDGFKVGDRVNYDGRNGTIIAISENNNLGVEFDEPVPCGHNCGWVKLKDGKSGKFNCCRWLHSSKLTHGELPKYYNGKVVCVSNENASDHGFTVGKIYNIVDGRFIDNDGTKRPLTGDKVKTIDDLNSGYFKNWVFRFIPFVED